MDVGGACTRDAGEHGEKITDGEANAFVRSGDNGNTVRGRHFDLSVNERLLDTATMYPTILQSWTSSLVSRC